MMKRLLITVTVVILLMIPAQFIFSQDVVLSDFGIGTPTNYKNIKNNTLGIDTINYDLKGDLEEKENFWYSAGGRASVFFLNLVSFNLTGFHLYNNDQEFSRSFLVGSSVTILPTSIMIMETLLILYFFDFPVKDVYRYIKAFSISLGTMLVIFDLIQVLIVKDPAKEVHLNEVNDEKKVKKVNHFWYTPGGRTAMFFINLVTLNITGAVIYGDDNGVSTFYLRLSAMIPAFLLGMAPVYMIGEAFSSAFSDEEFDPWKSPSILHLLVAGGCLLLFDILQVSLVREPKSKNTNNNNNIGKNDANESNDADGSNDTDESNDANESNEDDDGVVVDYGFNIDPFGNKLIFQIGFSF